MKQTMCVVRKYVVKRPEIEERERERDFYYLFIFLGFPNNNKTDLHSDGKETHSHKEEEGKTSIS